VDKINTLHDLEFRSFVRNLDVMNIFQFKNLFKNTRLQRIQLYIIPILCLFSLKVGAQITLGAEQTHLYLDQIKNKNIAIVANPSSRINKTHLVDSLFSLGISIKKIFALEHGFRGDAANGEHINSDIDKKTQLPVISLYGKHSKPTISDLEKIDLVIFDIQDVGVRFYTYLTSLHKIMEACAENGVSLLVLDRPNPNGYYIDGPILDSSINSMVGIHPIPVVHGMTLGELSLMIKGEEWINKARSLDLHVIPIANYNHNMQYDLPVPPSPNLPNSNSIALYPTLGLLEGTIMSMGRGTSIPFQCFGAPWLKGFNDTFTPYNIKGKAINPPYKGKLCHGYIFETKEINSLRKSREININLIINLYNKYQTDYDKSMKKAPFFKPFLTLLIGNKEFQKQIESGWSANQIRESWKSGLNKFKSKREPYLLYP